MSEEDGGGRKESVLLNKGILFLSRVLGFLKNKK
jgi:hypothetical protein